MSDDAKLGELVPLEFPEVSTTVEAERVQGERRFRSSRERANELRERMAKFSRIYNAGWMVRNAYYGPTARQDEAVKVLIAAMIEELRTTSDYTACMFALADALYASPSGVPWDS